MVMNKSGQFGGENTNLVNVLIVIGLLILVGGGIAYFISNTAGKLNSLAAQAPSNVANIAAACKLAVDSGVELLQGPYCLDAREATFAGTGFLGTGFLAKKQMVNCDYAADKKWFLPKSDKPLVCQTSYAKWAVSYCESLKTSQGDKYKDDVIVNGQTCKSHGVTKPVVASSGLNDAVGKDVADAIQKENTSQ